MEARRVTNLATDRNFGITASSPIGRVVVHGRHVAPGKISNMNQNRGLALVILARWRTVLVVSATAAVCTIPAVWFSLTPEYEVTATVHVAPVVKPVLVTDLDTDISRQYRDYLATQANIIASPGVVAAALKKLKASRLSILSDVADPVAFITSRLASEPIRATQLIRVSLMGGDGDEISAIVNHVLEVYLERDTKERSAWAADMVKALRDEETQLEGKLRNASDELRGLARNELEVSETALDTRVADLGQQLTEERKKQVMIEAKIKALDGDGTPPRPELLDSTGFSAYLAADPEWMGISEQFRSLIGVQINPQALEKGEKHPAIVGIPSRIEHLRSALRSRTEALRGDYLQVLRYKLNADGLAARISEQVLVQEMQLLAPKRDQLVLQTVALGDVRFEQERLVSALMQVRKKIWNIELEQRRDARIRIKSPPIAPTEPNIDKRPKFLLAAVMLSAMLGCVAGIAHDRLDRTVHSVEDISQQLGISVLGSVVDSVTRNGAIDDSGKSRASVQRLVATMLAVSSVRRPRCHLITSPAFVDGRSDLALALAKTLAGTKRRILLIDADNFRQRVSSLLEIKGRPGLRELLANPDSMDELITNGLVENLFVLPAGDTDDGFGQLLMGERAPAAFRRLIEQFDQTVIDCPPILESADAVALAAISDEVVLVVRAGKSTQEETVAAHQSIRALGDKQVHVVLVESERRGRGGHGKHPASINRQS